MRKWIPIILTSLLLGGCAMPPTAHMLVEECVMDLRDQAMRGVFSQRPDPDFGRWSEDEARLYCQSRYLLR